MADEVETAELPTDRPVQNVMGEFTRKFGQLEHTIAQQGQQISQLTGYLAEKEAASQPAAQAPKGTLSAMSKDELWELAKSGNKDAFDEHERRTAQSVYERNRAHERHTDLVDGQLQIIQGKYQQAFTNPNHPLSQIANTAYHLLVKRGYAPGPATLLEAQKTAIVDNPHIVAEMNTQGARAREGARQRQAGNSGVTGSTVRQDEPAQEGKVRVSVEQSAIARRMNVKDPSGAIQRFIKRQESGESKFGAVANSIQQEGF